MNDQQKVQAIIEIVRTGSGAADAKRDLEGVEKSTGLLDDKLKGLATTMAAVFSAREIARFAADSVRAYAESERGLNLLNSTLKASGQFSQAYVVELRSLAEALAEVSTADDDAIIAAERTMLSFGAQRRDMERLTKAALDLSVGLGVDLQSAAQQLGRAVAGETMSFNRLGFEIDENADAATRLDQVLSQIQTRFGGLAQGEMDTIHGRTTELKKAWGELKEIIGQTFGPTVAQAMRAAASELRALKETASFADQDKERAVIESDLELARAGGQMSELVYFAQREQLRMAFDARKQVSQVVVTDPEFQRTELMTTSEVDKEARVVALAAARGQLGNITDRRESDRRSEQAFLAGRSTGEQFGPPNPFSGEAFGPTDAEANMQRRKLAREAAEEIKALEQSLTLESIRNSDSRVASAENEYNQRVAKYTQLAAEHKISEDELTGLTRDAAFERDQVIEESIARQRELERRANEESRKEYQQLGNQIAHMFSVQVAGAIVQGFRSGKFEADKFFSDLLAQISEAILQFLILKAIMGIANSISGGAGSGLSGAVDAGKGFTSIGAGMAAGGLPPTFAAGGLEGVTRLDHAQFFPRFNVIAGEAGMEMMTVLSRPRPMAFGGVEAITGFAKGRELAVMSAGGASALAAAGGTGAGGPSVLRVELEPGLKATLVHEASNAAKVELTQSASRDSEFRRAIKSVVAG